ncbi:hypothetical protein BV20DRAFT_1082105 [Pilatotrama ljubarskyi]|nr:hypothetical protein BV20DRAFT_1082105 [Pilatotrama ljubarskyi]
MGKYSFSAVSSPYATFIDTIDLGAVRSLALEVYAKERADSPEPPTASVVSCTVVSPPRHDGHNIAYDLEFSNGLSWLIRIPHEEWGPLDARPMHLDIVAMEYITSRTSVPIPRLHAYCCTTDNPIGHLYMIMDKIHGIRLDSVWADASWWTGERRRENFFDSLAGFMVELAGLEFDKIGAIDRRPDGSFVIVPFVTGLGMTYEEFGPFQTTHEYLNALFVGALTEAMHDGAPFTTSHPDFDAQNIFVDNTGRVVGLIDWDGVSTRPREVGAVTYPYFLTRDWCPGMYDADEDQNNAYRRMYTEAVRMASGGKLDAVTRNSHVVSTLHLAVCGCYDWPGMLLCLGEYVFGSDIRVLDIWEGLQHGSWLTGPAKLVARVKLWPELDDSPSLDAVETAQGKQDAQETKDTKPNSRLSVLPGAVLAMLSASGSSLELACRISFPMAWDNVRELELLHKQHEIWPEWQWNMA